jgi:hypothetical protein
VQPTWWLHTAQATERASSPPTWVKTLVHPTMAALPLLRQTQQVSSPSLSKSGQSLLTSAYLSDAPQDRTLLGATSSIFAFNQPKRSTPKIRTGKKLLRAGHLVTNMGTVSSTRTPSSQPHRHGNLSSPKPGSIHLRSSSTTVPYQTQKAP